MADILLRHDDVIKWKHLPRYWPFLRGIHSPHKGQWRGALMLSLICAWINGLINNREAGDLRRHRAHYDLTVMGLRVFQFLHKIMLDTVIIDLLHKGHNAPVPYPAMHHFETEICTYVHITCTKRCAVGYVWCIEAFVKWVHCAHDMLSLSLYSIATMVCFCVRA